MPKGKHLKGHEFVGCKFGRWFVEMAFAHSGKVFCVCECGTRRQVVRSFLLRGLTTSCGCYLRENQVALRSSHGATANWSRTPTYRSWDAMTQRCTNPNNIGFADYGGRGIRVCERWRKFENFLADMGERPPGKTLDRFPDVDGNYEPNNCRWATAQEQQVAKRPRKQRSSPAQREIAA